MTTFLAELIGTAILILLGDGVVANVALNKTKGQNSGFTFVTIGWGLAVFVAVFIVSPVSGAHINPAVTLGLALAGNTPWAQVPIYMSAQLLGGMIGAFLVWVVYYDHFKATDDPATKLGVFATAPSIRRRGANFLSEMIGTFVLVYGVLYIVSPELYGPGGEPGKLGSLDALPVGLLVLVIGMALGGTTGYAINPARDLSPRIMHAILPIPGKGSSDWSYSWIPVLGPLAGGAAAAGLYLLLS